MTQRTREQWVAYFVEEQGVHPAEAEFFASLELGEADGDIVPAPDPADPASQP